MAVLAIKSEPRCKLCQSPERAAIDALLEQRSNGESDDQGNRINLAYVLRQFAAWGVANPNEDNVKVHWRKHCQKNTSQVVAAANEQAAEAVIKILRGEGDPVDVNADLDKLWAVGMAELDARIARGERSGLTPDMLLKIAAEKSRRSHNETQDSLLHALVGGIGASLQQAASPRKLPEGEVVLEIEATDAEVTEVEA